jgi:hypothetical protein
MANVLEEGIWPCQVLGATHGEDDRQSIVVRINVKFTEGPNKGRLATYEDQVNAKSSLYIGRSCKAVGWKGRSLTTLQADAEEWIERTGGASTAEVRHVPIKKGKKYDAWVADGRIGNAPVWDKINSIGRGPKPLSAPSSDALADAEEAMRRAMEEDGGPPDDDVPHPAGDDIPFATASTVGLGEIAKVLR